MKNELRILFMGTPDFAVASLKLLVENNFNVVGVITAPDKPAGRGQKIMQSAVKKYALSKNLKVLQPTNLKCADCVAEIQALNANLQIVVAFRMLPEVIWSMPQYGTFNLHASLLPQYRGAAPINWAIINGERETGVTTFFLQQKIDTGHIIAQEKVSIHEHETAGELHDKLMNIGADLVLKTTQMIEEDTVNAVPQQETTTLMEAPKIFKPFCKINWNAPTQEVHNHIRGLSPYPTAWTEFEHADTGKIVSCKIFKSKKGEALADMPTGTIVSGKDSLKIATSDGCINILELQLAGKKRMTIDTLLRGFDFSQYVLHSSTETA